MSLGFVAWPVVCREGYYVWKFAYPGTESDRRLILGSKDDGNVSVSYHCLDSILADELRAVIAVVMVMMVVMMVVVVIVEVMPMPVDGDDSDDGDGNGDDADSNGNSQSKDIDSGGYGGITIAMVELILMRIVFIQITRMGLRGFGDAGVMVMVMIILT